MSTPPNIIIDTRRFNHCTTTQYNDIDAYKDLNKLKDELWNKIVSEGISSNYNWDIWTTDSNSLESEYKLDIPTSSNPGQKTLNSVYINYDGETYTETGALKYIKCTEKDPKNMPYSWEYYAENQDKKYPIYYQKDNSIFIAPTPRATDAGTNRIQLEGIRKIADWDENTTELQMKFPVEFHYIFETGLAPYALMSKGADTNTVNNAKAQYRADSVDVVKQMTQRIEAPFNNVYPDQEPIDNNPY